MPNKSRTILHLYVSADGACAPPARAAPSCLGGEYIPENMVNIAVCFLSVFWCKHDNFPNHIIGFYDFLPHHKGVSSRTRTGSTLADLPKAVPEGGVLARSSAPSDPIGAQRSGSDWERRSSGINELFPVGEQRMLRSLLRRCLGVGCGTLICSGGSPYCWHEIFNVHSLMAVSWLYRMLISLYVEY